MIVHYWDEIESSDARSNSSNRAHYPCRALLQNKPHIPKKHLTHFEIIKIILILLKILTRQKLTISIMDNIDPLMGVTGWSWKNHIPIRTHCMDSHSFWMGGGQRKPLVGVVLLICRLDKSDMKVKHPWFDFRIYSNSCSPFYPLALIFFCSHENDYWW